MQIPVRLEALEDGGECGNRERMGDRRDRPNLVYSVEEKILVSIYFSRGNSNCNC